jgi:O-antigen ligase
MKLASALSEVEARKVQTFVLLGGVFTTLAIWTKLEDPVNLPKMFVLVLFGAIVLGLLTPTLLGASKSTTGNKKIGLSLIGLFIIALLVSTFTTDVKYTAIFGEYHRNNGALSYLAMAFLFAGSVATFSGQSSIRFFKFFAITGLLLTGYGFLQAAGKDPVGWKLDYNPFITTLGNPNFTSAFLGLAGVAILLLAVEAKDRKIQVLYTVGLLADLYILFKSGSIQGLFGFLIGATVIVITKLWLVNKKFGQICLIFAAIGATPVALAVFNLGPLASKLYQGTLRNRLDYWDAAFAMFKDHPIFGVGIDRYGEYYRQYAVQNQVVQGQVTDNAHSVYMQLLSTGGLILFIPYLALIAYVTFIGTKALSRANGNEKLLIAGVFAIWIGTLAVNIVAIDNLGVAVWFWITGGVLVAVSSDKAPQTVATEKVKKSASRSRTITNASEFPYSNLLAGALGLSVLLILLPNLSASEAVKSLSANTKNLSVNAYVAELNKQVSDNQSNPQNLILLADVALRQGEIDLSYEISSRIRELDPRSFYGQYLPALAYEATGKPGEAISYREKLVVLDPWNTSNMLQLIKNYMALDEKAKASAIAKKINENYPGSPADLEASTLLAG